MPTIYLDPEISIHKKFDSKEDKTPLLLQALFQNNLAETVDAFERSVDALELKSSQVERRMAVDVGSGSTKFCIADIDLKTNQIVQIVYKDSIAVPYQKSLEENKGQFDASVKEMGLSSFQVIQEYAKFYHVDKIVAVATEAFRTAQNAFTFTQEIAEKTGTSLRIISQQEEGEIAFFSALASEVKVDPSELLVWDIGTGSYQMTMKKEEDLLCFMGNTGSHRFQQNIIEYIQEKPGHHTINPMTIEEFHLAEHYVRYLARKASSDIKARIKDLDGKVMGMGRLFYNSIKPMAYHLDVITRRDLREFIYANINRTDEEINDPFSHVNLSNAILVLGFMKALHIHKIFPVDTTSTQGILIDKNFWEVGSI